MFSLLSSLLFLSPPSAATLRHLQVGSTAPDFVLKNVGGDEQSLDNLLGEKLTLLIFWASWSTKSEAALKKARALFEKYQGHGLSVIAINSEGESNNRQKPVTSMADRLQPGFPNLIDYRLDTFSDYGVIALPTIVILDRTKTIQYELSGFPIVGAEEMANFVTATLKGRKPPLTLRQKIGYQPNKRAMMLFNTGNNALLRSRSRAALAERWFLKSIAADPKFAAPHLALGRLYLESTQTDKAKSHFKQAISKQPDSVVALCELGMLLINAGEHAEGESLMAKGIKSDAAYTPCYYYLGYIYGRQSHLEQSQKMFEKAKEINRADSNIYIYQAKLFEAQKNYSAAAKNYRQALRLMLKL
ncbi:MAG: redoxin domain-containing protein [Candidatus Polarisedimenticolaceae bacterium]|nr:redoxin domain-containing protein [Candidatus Polarisedimenticolaceae bacterium]